MDEPEPAEWSELEVLKAMGTQLRLLNAQVSTMKNIMIVVVAMWFIGAAYVVLAASDS